MTDLKYECPTHHSLQNRGEYCQGCVDWLETRPAANDMTGKERKEEMKHWIDVSVLTIPFGRLCERFGELVGRPVWTHEMATSGLAGLMMEAAQPRTQDHDHTKITDQGQDVVVARLEGLIGKDKVVRFNTEDYSND